MNRAITDGARKTHSESASGSISAERQVSKQMEPGGQSPDLPASLAKTQKWASGRRKQTATGGTNSEIMKLIRKAKKYGRDPGDESLWSISGITCSQESYGEKVHTGVLLVEKYCNSLGISNMDISNMCPVGFANFMLRQKPRWKKSTWNRYRTCFKTVLRQLPHPKNDLAISLIEEGYEHPLAHLHLDPPEPADKPAAKAKRSKASKPSKGFPKQDFDALLNHFETHHCSKYQEIVIAWLKAGLATGLRPIEWQTVSIERLEDQGAPPSRQVLLHVLNAKSTNGRANGLTRTLDISNFLPDTIEAIEWMAEFGEEALKNGSFPFYMRACSKVIYVACKAVFKGDGSVTGRTYSLYNLRHQFIANMKTLKSRQDVADLAGHISIETARTNYARKRDAWPLKDIHDIASVHNPEVAVKHEPPQIENRSDLGMSWSKFMV